MKKLLGMCLSLILLLSIGGVVVAGGEETGNENTAPVIQKPVLVTITDELDNLMSGVTVEVTDAEGNVVGTYESVDGALTAFLEKGTYTLTITGVPEGYCVTTDPVTIDVTLTETEQEFDIRAGTISDTDPDHELFCNHNPSHLESYRVRDNGEEIVGYCFNQNYDPPSFDAEDCTYKRLVGTPELLYELAQSKLEGITPQELYDHVLSMIYHRDDIQEKYKEIDFFTLYKSLLHTWRRQFKLQIRGLHIDLSLENIKKPKHAPGWWRSGPAYSIMHNKWIHELVRIDDKTLREYRKLAKQRVKTVLTQAREVVASNGRLDEFVRLQQKLRDDAMRNNCPQPLVPETMAYKMLRGSGLFRRLLMTSSQRRAVAQFKVD